MLLILLPTPPLPPQNQTVERWICEALATEQATCFFPCPRYFVARTNHLRG